MATHSSILAWRILMDRAAWWATVHTVTKSWTRLKRLSMHTHQRRRCKRHGFEPWVWTIPWSRKWQADCQENFKDRGAWWAAVHGVTNSQTQLSTCDHTVDYYTAMKMKHTQYGLFFNLKMNDREFPGGPVVRILGFHCRVHRFNPCSVAKKIRNEWQSKSQRNI